MPEWPMKSFVFGRPLLFGRARRSVWPLCVTLVKTDKQWLLFNWIADYLRAPLTSGAQMGRGGGGGGCNLARQMDPGVL